MTSKKVLIVTRFHPVLKEILTSLNYELVEKEALPYEDAIKEISEYEGLVTSNHLKVDKDLLDAATNLKWVGRLGSGMEIIDTDYAAQKGVACFSSPAGNANAVAEQALGMLLALRHNIFKGQKDIENGQWLRDENRGYEIEGMTAGIIGLGNNGSLFAQKLKLMGLRVLAYDIAQNNYDMEGIECFDDMQTIFEEAEILSFHIPLNKANHHFFNSELLQKMQRNFILLNLCRGPVVEQDIVYQGLKSGKIIGAAFDVWEQEPFWKDENSKNQALELLQMPNFIGTPHIAGYTHNATYKMSKIIAEQVRTLIEKS